MAVFVVVVVVVVGCGLFGYAGDGDGEGLMGDRRERGGKGGKGMGVKQGLRMRGVTWGGIGEGGRQKN